MMDIGNNLGNNRVCTCGEKETSEHKIRCRERKVKEEDKINEEWLREKNYYNYHYSVYHYNYISQAYACSISLRK